MEEFSLKMDAVRPAEWVADFLDEVSSFPAAQHDDMVDSMTQALNYLRESNSGLIDFYVEGAKALEEEKNRIAGIVEEPVIEYWGPGPA